MVVFSSFKTSFFERFFYKANKFNFTSLYSGLDPTGNFYYETNDFSQSEHSGTHLDAPAHFSRGKWRTGDIPLARLGGPAVVVNIEDRAREEKT